MALIRRLTKTTKDRQRVHDEIECSFSAFTDPKGQPYLQLDTYGSKSRKIVGKMSQSLQFDAEAAAQLMQVLRDVFPKLRSK